MTFFVSLLFYIVAFLLLDTNLITGVLCLVFSKDLFSTALEEFRLKRRLKNLDKEYQAMKELGDKWRQQKIDKSFDLSKSKNSDDNESKNVADSKLS